MKCSCIQQCEIKPTGWSAEQGPDKKCDCCLKKFYEIDGQLISSEKYEEPKEEKKGGWVGYVFKSAARSKST